MNPLVAPHIEFLPEETHGKHVYKLSQLQKWLKHQPSDLRVQMVESKNKHYYLFEPVKTRSMQIMVPLFLYLEKNIVHARCCRPIVKSNHSHSDIKLEILADLAFDDERLQSVPVEEMSLPYPEIEMMNKLKLSECCGNLMSGTISNHVHT